jgi:hypothetical protein
VTRLRPAVAGLRWRQRRGNHHQLWRNLGQRNRFGDDAADYPY